MAEPELPLLADIEEVRARTRALADAFARHAAELRREMAAVADPQDEVRPALLARLEAAEARIRAAAETAVHGALHRRLGAARLVLQARTHLRDAELPPVVLPIVLSTHPAPEHPTIVVVVVPAPFEVYSAWNLRPEDLCTLLTWRIQAGMVRALIELGRSDAPLTCRPFGVLLAIQAWLGEDAHEGALDAFRRALRTRVAAGREFEEAHVTFRLVELPPEMLSPRRRDRRAG